MSAAKSPKHPGAPAHSERSVSIFPTEIGWMGVVGSGHIVQAVYVGHPSAVSVRKAAGLNQLSLQESDWHPKLREALQDYALGKHVSFAEFELQLPNRTIFRDKVLAATRRLGYGQTTTYGDLARQVGHPGAARAVGTVMSTNRFPILIPCHRVLGAGRKLGGYTCPAGTDLKQRLLEMESIAQTAGVKPRTMSKRGFAVHSS